jgi:predicted methyltransferase
MKQLNCVAGFRLKMFKRDTLFILFSGFILSQVLVFNASAEEQNVNPGINRHYENPDFDLWVGRFERPGREVYDRRFDIVAATGVTSGMVVADIGAGTGLFTRLFSSEVGAKGHVYAVDITREFIENIIRINQAKGLTNIKGIVSKPRDVSLPYQSVDIAFICNAYHHFEYPQSIMTSIKNVLRPDGTLIVIDYRKVFGTSSEWTMAHVRAEKEAVIDEIEQSGFKLVAEKAFLEANYYLKFKLKNNL